MKIPRPLLLLAFVLALPLHAEQLPDAIAAAPATIEGRVSEKYEGKYLVNARITIAGTHYEDLTNEYGDYRIAGLAPGDYTITAFFTGLTPQTFKVTLAPGQIATHDIELSSEQLDAEGPIVRLDQYSVVATRETSISAIATNEQRFATNIKTVIDTGAFGDITSGNVGDFLKFMPGVAVNYDGPDPQSAMVRGFGASYTAVTFDGMAVANAAGGDETRTFQFDQMSLNNVSRIEVTKEPLPSQRADSLGGNVNMVSKNAFERKTMQFTYRAGVDFNSQEYEFFRKTSSPGQFPSRKVRANFDFDLTLPINKNFGIVVTGQHSDRFTEQRASRYEWYFQNDPREDFNNYIMNASASWRPSPDSLSAFYFYNSTNSPGYKPGFIVANPPPVGSTPTDLLMWNPLFYGGLTKNGDYEKVSDYYTSYLQTDPYMRRYQVADQPKLTSKDSFGLRADWRINRNSTLSLSWNIGYTAATQQKNTISWDISQTVAQNLPVRTPLANSTDLFIAGTPTNNNQTADEWLMNLYLTDPNPIINPAASAYFRQWGYDPQYGGYYAISPNNGQAKIKHNAGAVDKYGITNAVNLIYRYTGSEWTFDMTLNGSIAKSWQRDMQNGHFSNVLTKISGNVDRVLIGGIQTQDAPTMLMGYDTTGKPVDINDLSLFQIDSVTTNPGDSKDTFKTVQMNVQRNLNFFPFYATLKTGGEIRTQERDTVKNKLSWTLMNTNAAPFTDIAYSNRAQAWGLPNLPFPSSYLLYQDYLSVTSTTPGETPAAYPGGFPYTSGADNYVFYNPTYYNAPAPGNNPPEKYNSNYNAFMTYKYANDYNIEETITSFYVQLDAKFLDNRLSITTGFRFEQTQDRGLSAYMPAYKIEDPSNKGHYLSDEQLNSTGIYTTNSGATKDMYSLLMADFAAQNWIIRGNKSYKSYADIYPSFFANYNITPNTIARLAYAKTLGRPDFNNIIPIARYNENTTVDGDPYVRIKTSNPALKPYKADNLDISLEYYFKNGGVASVNAFYKNIANPFGETTRAGTPQMMAEMGIANTFPNPVLVTRVNLDGRLTAKGVELNTRLPLDFIPEVGRYLSITANATVMDIKAPYNAELDGFVKQSASWGLNVISKRLVFRLNWNYRGEQKLRALTDTQYQPQDETQTARPEDFQGFYEYVAPRLTLDANLEYRVAKYLNFFINGRNLTNARMVWQRYNDLTPDYAKTYQTEQYGIQVAFGIKGSF